MHKTTALLISISLWMPLVSVVYFLSLVAAVPFLLAVVVSVCLLPLIILAVNRLARVDSAPELSRASGILLLVGVLLLCGACALLGRRYGDFDAALIWNLHARHLATGNWRRIYEPGASGNAAYPFGLPGFVAAMWRSAEWNAVKTFSPIVPYVVALFATVGIPMAIFLQTARRHVVVGIGVLAAFGLYPYYVALGLDQYADIQIALLLLLSAVCVSRMKSAPSAGYAILLGALLGAICWTKYEGFLLSLVMLLCHQPLLRKLTRIGLLALGALPFAIAWVVLRYQGAPASPLMQDLATVTAQATDGLRYRLTAGAFLCELTGVHLPLAILLIAYPVLCLRQRLRFSPVYGALWTAMFCFAAVYVLLVTTDLEWNLQFSLPRLLLQLYPALVFITAKGVAEWLDIRGLKTAAENSIS